MLNGRFSTNKVGCTIREHAEEVSSIFFSADGSRLVSGSDDKTAPVYDVATGAPACQALTGHTDMVWRVPVSAEWSRVVSSSPDETMRVWEVATGAPACEALTGNTGSVTSVAMSGEGNRVVSGSSNKMVRVWDVATGAPAYEALMGHLNWVTSVAISADGSRVGSGLYEKTVRVWAVATEYCLLVTSSSKWYETLGRYCGCIEEHREATSSEEECERYYFERKAVKLQRGNGKEEVLAQLQPESIWSAELPVVINSRKRVVVAKHPNGGIGVFRIIR